MRALVLSPSYPRSEADTRVAFIRAFVKELAKEIEVEVVTSSAPDNGPLEQKMDKANIFRFNYFFPRQLQKLSYTSSGGMLESFRRSFLAKIQAPIFLLSFFLKARKHAKSCDVIHAQWLLAGFVGAFLKKFYKKPLICEVRGADLRSMPAWFIRYTLKHVDHVISWTPEMTDLLYKHDRSRNIHDIKGMIDFEKLESKKGAEAFRKEVNPKRKFLVTFLGRMVHMKNPLGFIRTVPSVIAKDKDVQFIMAGDGDLMPDAQRLVEKLGVQDSVKILGPRSDVNAILRNTDVFVGLSPICHTFSATIMEAMHLGVPCILDTPPYTEGYFTHQKYAYLVPQNDPEKLAQAILLLKKDTKLRDTLSKNGPLFVKKLGFEKKEIIRKTIALYKKAITEGG